MRPFHFLLIALLSLAACTPSDTEKETAPPPSEPVKKLASETDTFFCGKNLLALSDTSKQAFDKARGADADTSEANQLHLNSAAVNRHGDTLVLSLTNGTTKRLLSTHYTEGMDSFYEYKYLGKIGALNYHLVYVAMYEAFAYLAVNAANGHETRLWGEPAVSPDQSRIAASCFDLQAGFVYNGVQLFKVGSDSLMPVGERELSTWGADHIAWLDNDHLLAEKLRLDSSQNVLTSYIKISGYGK